MTTIDGGAVLELTFPVKRFIEDNISLIEQNELTLFCYNAMFSLKSEDTAELVEILRRTLDISLEQSINDALVYWCMDNVALKHRDKVQLSKLIIKLPRFGYENVLFRNMVVNAIKTAYPNKTCLPDSYGIEYIVEKI